MTVSARQVTDGDWVGAPGDSALGGRLTVRQGTAAHRISTDTILLAASVVAQAGDDVLELGSGTGGAALCVGYRVQGCSVMGLERDGDLVALANSNAAANGLAERVRFVAGDVTAPPGAVPQTGAPLMLYHNPSGEDIDLVWGVDCGSSLDFAVYRGWLGAWESHEAELCSTGGASWATLPEHPDSYYFLVTAHNGLYEGSYGVDSSGAPRPPAYVSCTGAWNYAECP